LYGLDSVDAGDPALWRLWRVENGDECAGELGWVAGLLPAHALPGGNRLGGPLCVVVDGQFRPSGRLLLEQLRAKEPGLNDGCRDATGRDLRTQRLHPS